MPLQIIDNLLFLIVLFNNKSLKKKTCKLINEQRMHVQSKTIGFIHKKCYISNNLSRMNLLLQLMYQL